MAQQPVFIINSIILNEHALLEIVPPVRCLRFLIDTLDHPDKHIVGFVMDVWDSEFGQGIDIKGLHDVVLCLYLLDDEGIQLTDFISIVEDFGFAAGPSAFGFFN